MSEHRARIAIAAPAGEVFAFLANPTNLPRWQPALREAFREEGDRIRAIGGGLGEQGVAAHLRFVVDQEAHRLSWSTETGTGCAGDATVRQAEDGALLDLVLRLGDRAERPDALRRWTGDPALDLDAAIRSSLEAVRRHFEAPVQGIDLVSGGSQANPGEAALRDSRAYGTSPEPGRG